jgi:hypothetical protein
MSFNATSRQCRVSRAASAASFTSRLTPIALAVGLAVSVPAFAAGAPENIIYQGDADYGYVQAMQDSILSGGDDVHVLAPSSEAPASGNSVILQTLPSSTWDKPLDDVLGGYLFNPGAGSAYDSVQNNVVSIAAGDGNDFNNPYLSAYGGFAESEDASVSAQNNQATLESGSLGWLEGGLAAVDTGGSGDALAQGNAVTATGGEVGQEIIGGEADNYGNGNATASQNSVTLNAGSDGVLESNSVVGGEAYAEGSGKAKADSNSVSLTLQNASTAATVAGGAVWGTAQSEANGNRVDVQAKSIGGNEQGGPDFVTGNNKPAFFGGYVSLEHAAPTANATANSNQVQLDLDGSLTASVLVGGYVDIENEQGVSSNVSFADSNSLNVQAKGGIEIDTDEYSNRLPASAGVYGGLATVVAQNSDSDSSQVQATANDNKVSLSATDGGFSMSGWENFGTGVFGGLAEAQANFSNVSATANGNALEMSFSGDIDLNGDSRDSPNYLVGLFGGYASSTGAASADQNVVSLSASNLSLAGGSDGGSVYGGLSSSTGGAAEANGNQVSIDLSGSASDGASVYGGESESAASGDTSANGNSVNVALGEFSDAALIGGMSLAYGGAAQANGNSVTFSGAAGGETQIAGGYAVGLAGDATATGNTVIIQKNPAPDAVSAFQGAIYGGFAGSDASGGLGKADDNTVIFQNGAMASGNVYGGYSVIDTGAGSTGEATGNTVELTGDADLSGADVYGGFVADGNTYKAATGDALTGNTLSVSDYTGTGVDSIQNFEQYRFMLPKKLDISRPVLAVASDANLQGSKFSMDFEGDVSPIKVGESVDLIRSEGTMEGEASQTENKIRRNAGSVYDFEIDEVPDENRVTAKLASVDTSGSKGFVEGFTAGAALLTTASDFAVRILDTLEGSAKRSSAFGIVGGGKQKFDTGSHIDLRSVNAVAGLATLHPLSRSVFVVSAFVEAGRGNYDTYNSFYTGGDNAGNAKYAGAGIIGKIGGDKGLYAEGSLRAGRVTNHFKADNLRNDSGIKGDYDVHSSYFGAHVGGGYVLPLNPKLSMNLYGKFFYSRMAGDEAKAKSGDRLRFDRVNSFRARLGAKLDYAVAPNATLFGGLAFEHEFDGKAKAQTYVGSWMDIEAPKLKGSTGELEIGAKFALGAKWTLKVDAQGYAGKRQGVSGAAKAVYSF